MTRTQRPQAAPRAPRRRHAAATVARRCDRQAVRRAASRNASASCLASLGRPPPALESPPSRRAAYTRRQHAAAAGRAACTTPPPRGGYGRPEVRPPGRPANPRRSPRRPTAVGAMDGPTAVNSEVIPHADAGAILVVEHELILRVGAIQILEPDAEQFLAAISAPGPARLHDHVAAPVEFLS